MSELMLGASSFINELLFITKDITWKDEATAQKYETPDSAFHAEEYLLAMTGELTFDNIFRFDEEVLLTAGLDAETATNVADMKELIPEYFRDTCVRLQTQYIIDHYEDWNNYYRMLNGLPDMEDEEFFYNTKYPDISDSTTPLHKLGIAALYTLEALGLMDELFKEHPEKKYLLHMGSKKISPYTARISSKFSILYMNQSEFTKINSTFRDCYNTCKYALQRALYVPEMRKENPYYDNFFALSVLFMSIQQMFALYLDADLTMDFYDYESLKYVYDSYGVPFYASIPLDYHIKIVRNINKLISHKGSTKVFFELFDIFNYGTMDVFDFYVMKLHKFDEDGKPIFAYNPDGSLDTRAMYELKFSQVRLYDNPPLELSDSTNHMTYFDMTAGDKYWISDKDLLDKLYDTEFNYMETKYIGVRTIFDLMSIVSETAYFFKLMADKRKTVRLLSVYFSPMNISIDMYTLIIYIAALVCNKFGYEGSLEGNPAYVAKVMGFNFKVNLDEVINNIKKDPKLKGDVKLINLLSTMYINTTYDLNRVVGNIKTLHKYLNNKKAEAKTLQEYRAYSELQKTLMISEYMNDAFKKSNGQNATSFSDLLGDLFPDLFVRFQNIGGELDSELNICLTLFEQQLMNLKYLQMGVNLSSNAMLEHLFKLLEFFKSAKAELTGYQLAYIMTKRNDTMDKFMLVHKKSVFNFSRLYTHSELEMLTDAIAAINMFFYHMDEIHWNVKMELKYMCTHIREAKIRLLAKIKLIQYWQIAHLVSKDMLTDTIKVVEDKLKINDGFKLVPRLDLIMEKLDYEGRNFLINEEFKELIDKILKIQTENISTNDDFNRSTVHLKDSDYLEWYQTFMGIVTFVLGIKYHQEIKRRMYAGELEIDLKERRAKLINHKFSDSDTFHDSMTYHTFYSKTKDTNAVLKDRMRLIYERRVEE